MCRDLELRVHNKSNRQGKIAEVCIDDEWHEATSAKSANNSQSPQDITVMTADLTSVMIKWSSGQSIPNDNKIISGYDLSCRTSSLSDGQIHEVRVPNISMSTIEIQVHGLLPGTAYECCVNAHIHTNTPIDLISFSCVATSTESLQEPRDELVIGLGTGLGICSILMALVVGINVGCMVSKTCTSSCLKCDSTMKGTTQRYDNILTIYLYTLNTPRGRMLLTISTRLVVRMSSKHMACSGHMRTG